MEPKINGGYYIKARCIQNSEIAIMPPYIREIWDWLLKEANHSDSKSNGSNIERGQLVRTFKDIQEGLKWMIGWRKMTYKKWQCENAMKFLRERSMITTKKTTRGMFVTICNYSLYQDPKNNGSNRRADTRTTDNKQTTDTINNNGNNVKNVNNGKKKIDSAKYRTMLREQIIYYLNTTANKDYKPETPLTIKLINLRLKEGYSLDDFKKVIDVKNEEWRDKITKDGKNMEDWLRPQTLFGNKFESYLNQRIIGRSLEEKLATDHRFDNLK